MYKEFIYEEPLSLYQTINLWKSVCCYLFKNFKLGHFHRLILKQDFSHLKSNMTSPNTNEYQTKSTSNLTLVIQPVI